MFKKFLLPLLLLLTLNLNGCIVENSKYISFTSKPSTHYYTDKLKNKVLNNEKFSLLVFDTNLYKEIPVDKDEFVIVDNFLTSLSSNNYLQYDSKPDTKEMFRITISFDDSKYLIRVYDSSIIAISPWDGSYEEDIISMENIPLRYNLLDFCNHIQNKPLQKH